MVNSKGQFITDLAAFLAIMSIIVGAIWIYTSFVEMHGRLQVLTDVSKIYVYDIYGRETEEFSELSLKYAFEKLSVEFGLSKDNIKEIIEDEQKKENLESRAREIYVEYMSKLSEKRPVEIGEVQSVKIEEIDGNVKLQVEAKDVKIGYGDQFIFIVQNQVQTFFLS